MTKKSKSSHQDYSAAAPKMRLDVSQKVNVGGSATTPIMRQDSGGTENAAPQKSNPSDKK